MSYKDQYDKWRVHDLIGPASHAAVDLSSSLQDISQRQSQWQETLKRMQQEVDRWPADQREAVSKRCDVGDMYDTTQKVAADEGLVQDLRQWLWARAYAGTDDPACIDQAIIDSLGRSKSAAPATPGRAASVGSDANAAAGPSRARSTSPESLQGASRGGGSTAASEPSMRMPAAEEPGRAPLISPAIAKHRQALENSKLGCCRPCRESTVYMRKTRQADSQGLYCIKTSLPVSSTFKLDDPLAPHKSLSVPSDAAAATLPEELVVTVFVHPIVNRIYSKPRSERIPVPARAQRIVLLASQTLDDFRDALVSSAGTIPTEAPTASDHVTGNSMLDVDEEGEDEEEELDPTEQHVEYTNTPWESKCVIGIGDRLYADTDTTDSSEYINIIMDLVQRHGHSRPTHESRLITSASQLDEDDALRFLQDDEQHQNANNMLDHDADASPDIQTGYGMSGTPIRGAESPSSVNTDNQQQQRSSDQDRNAVPKRELKYQPSGMSLMDTCFEDIIGGIRLREPCFLLQQGLDERVFEFEDIRLLHPSDPAPTFDGKDVYPITTFLSKLPATKCNVCDRDPATRITLHDELAGVSPCYICDFCFKCFHEDEDGARENGVEIIPFLDQAGQH